MIKKAEFENIKQILDCFIDSKLFDSYFYDPHHKAYFIEDSIKKDELYVFTDDINNILAFMRIDLSGMFSRFPLLRLICVHPDLRNKGYGTILLKHYEEIGFHVSSKIFLCVSDFNDRAKKLYERQGYIKVGEIPDLYKENITEYLLMKYNKI